MKQVALLLIIISTLLSCSNGEIKSENDTKKIQKESETKEVQVLKETLIGQKTSKSFKSLNGEFYVIVKFKNDCNEYFDPFINCLVEATRDPNGTKQSYDFTGSELKFGESTIDTLRVFNEPDTYFIKTYMSADCKLELEVIDIQ